MPQSKKRTLGSVRGKVHEQAASLPRLFADLVHTIGKLYPHDDGGDGGGGDNNTRSNNRTAVTASDIDAHTAPDGRECNASSLAPIFVIAAVAWSWRMQYERRFFCLPCCALFCCSPPY